MLALKGWNTSKSRRTQPMLLPAESLKLTAVSSLSGSRGLRNMAALMLFAIESHSSSQRPCPDQSMNPTSVNEDTRQAAPFAMQLQRVCYDTLPSLILFSLGREHSAR